MIHPRSNHNYLFGDTYCFDSALLFISCPFTEQVCHYQWECHLPSESIIIFHFIVHYYASHTHSSQQGLLSPPQRPLFPSAINQVGAHFVYATCQCYISLSLSLCPPFLIQWNLIQLANPHQLTSPLLIPLFQMS